MLFKKLIVRFFNCICHGWNAEVQLTIVSNFFSICFNNFCLHVVQLCLCGEERLAVAFAGRNMDSDLFWMRCSKFLRKKSDVKYHLTAAAAR